MDWLTMTHTNAVGATLRSWQKRSGSRFGRWLFGRRVCSHAPHIRTLKPRFSELRPALCKVAIANRKAVRDSHGAVQWLANLCELAAGMVTEVTIPPTLTWVIRGMTIEYLRRSQTGVTATARLDKTEWSDTQNVGVPVSVVDDNGAEVVRAVISINVSAKGPA
jgi:acyl-coenzyme A thioesterase PaaI-like protein